MANQPRRMFGNKQLTRREQNIIRDMSRTLSDYAEDTTGSRQGIYNGRPQKVVMDNAFDSVGVVTAVKEFRAGWGIEVTTDAGSRVILFSEIDPELSGEVFVSSLRTMKLSFNNDDANPTIYVGNAYYAAPKESVRKLYVNKRPANLEMAVSNDDLDS